jgi:phospholipase D-like protein
LVLRAGRRQVLLRELSKAEEVAMSFWEVTIFLFVVIPLLAIWVFCLFHIVARPDLKVWAKVLWLVGILVLPIIGAVAYLIAWKKHGPIDDTKEWEDKSARDIEDEMFRSTHMTSADRSENTRLF